jgi:hypothetical protein
VAGGAANSPGVPCRAGVGATPVGERGVAATGLATAMSSSHSPGATPTVTRVISFMGGRLPSQSDAAAVGTRDLWTTVALWIGVSCGHGPFLG